MPTTKHVHESRTVEISIYGLNEGSGAIPRSYSTASAFNRLQIGVQFNAETPRREENAVNGKNMIRTRGIETGAELMRMTSAR